MENFRTPNFELVADILHWLTRKYDNEAGISDRIESVDDRVTFLTQIVQVKVLYNHAVVVIANSDISHWEIAAAVLC